MLEEFWKGHEDAREPALAWLSDVGDATWKTPHEMKARYPKASIIGNQRVVFNLRGNKYRLLVVIEYVTQTVLIERVGTHAEYDGWGL